MSDHVIVISDDRGDRVQLNIGFFPSNGAIQFDVHGNDTAHFYLNASVEDITELRDILNKVLDDAKRHKEQQPPPSGKATCVSYGDWNYWFHGEVIVPFGVDYPAWLWENAVFVLDANGQKVK